MPRSTAAARSNPLPGPRGRLRYQYIVPAAMPRAAAYSLLAIKAELRRRLHAPVDETAAWLESVVREYFAYHEAPTNIQVLGSFQDHAARL
ncbi:MAG: hypothetical protein U1F36_16955 [Planctomycetota bacterium]